MKRTLGAIVLLMLISSSANAALLSRLGGQAVYDTDFNITWVADANLAQTSGYSATGLMNLNNSQAWIDSLNTADYLGVSDWRLPTTLQPDASCSNQNVIAGDSWGTNCLGSEMGHMFYTELGGVPGGSIAAAHNASYDLFQNIKPDGYWSGTTYAAGAAWYFFFRLGDQELDFQTTDYYAWAVAPGDIAAVPLPPAAFLFPSAIGLLGWVRRKRTRLT